MENASSIVSDALGTKFKELSNSVTYPSLWTYGAFLLDHQNAFRRDNFLENSFQDEV